MAPFCGNSVSAANTGGATVVAVGACGKCQLATTGDYAASECKMGMADSKCPLTTSCGGSKVCCVTGECVTPGATGGTTMGTNCST